MRRTTTAGTIDESSTQARGPRLLVLPIGDIAESPDNTRLFETGSADDRQALDELAASIRHTGLQQLPKVRPSGGTPPWVVVYGARRLRACRDVLKWHEMTVIVDEGLDQVNAAAATVVENMQRCDLHPMDEARGLAILRGHGQTTKQIAARLGRREEWVKERLKLCDLPPRVQDIYRQSTRMTLHQALDLHDYTHGGRDNTGFPDLMIALAECLDEGGNPMGALATISRTHPHLAMPIQHAYHDGQGRWAGNYFDTKKICTTCPFAAYRPGYYEGAGYCLLPEHYQDLQRKGRERFEAVQADEERARGENPASGPVPSVATGPAAPAKTPAQKGQETKRRHQQQKADYAPTIAAIERIADMIPAVDGVDLAVLAAYTLTTRHVHADALQQVIRRHGLKGFPGIEPTPTSDQIKRLRAFEPVQLVRYTLEALLTTQAQRARDYDPGKDRADAVLALYLAGHEAEQKRAASARAA